MISTSSIINCINPTCTTPRNPVGSRECAACHTPLVYKYVWAAGEEAGKVPVDEIVADRYEVVAPSIWLDTKPSLLDTQTPVESTVYYKFYHQHLHIPQVYDLIGASKIILLENVPIDNNGKLYPPILDAWEQATAVRQVYWLWQILQLWKPLSSEGVQGSLLVSNNLRVTGWRLRLLELITAPASIQQLGEHWQHLVLTAHPSIRDQLESIVKQITQYEPVDIKNIQIQLNHLLLSAASELPLSIKTAGATHPGAQLKQNEDACFPSSGDAEESQLVRLSIVCDGIGGHEGGEVASQLAVQSVKLQVRALLAEVALSNEPVPPDLLMSQLEASLRVVNNLICNANDQQHRSGKQRMGTTLVMALQVAQTIQTPMGWDAENSHELYIASIGDSRAYWITRDGYQQLTLDDDIAAREVRNGRSLYRKALSRADAGALTQALGTKEAQNLHFSIQRFIIEEDGLLVLCSDGFSDNNLVERTWQSFAPAVLNGYMTVSEAVDAWINKANQINGHDNISLVLNYCHVSPDYVSATSQTPLHIFDNHEEADKETEELVDVITIQAESDNIQELDSDSQPPLDLELPSEAPVVNGVETPHLKNKRLVLLRFPLVWLVSLTLLLLVGSGVGLFVWWRYSPKTFNSLCRQLPITVQRVCPNRK
ncbi:serine/threonine protein phosphatase [Calothrix sp. HK-06]|nr:serine/threonine protein phosphatase [Calothrix sp. HK-06]